MTEQSDSGVRQSRSHESARPRSPANRRSAAGYGVSVRVPSVSRGLDLPTSAERSRRPVEVTVGYGCGTNGVLGMRNRVIGVLQWSFGLRGAGVSFGNKLAPRPELELRRQRKTTLSAGYRQHTFELPFLTRGYLQWPFYIVVQSTGLQ